MNDRKEQERRISLETQAEIEKGDHRIKIGLLVVSTITVVLLFWAALGENVLAEWRQLRGDYKGLLRTKAADDFGRTLAESFRLDVDQNVVLEMARIDRCISCHTGIDDPRMADALQPFKAHRGRFVQIHEPAKFGCTVCHEGQGQATTTEDAHGRVAFWDRPMLDRSFMKSSCSKCHARQELFGAARLIDRARDDTGIDPGSGLLDLGWRLMTEKGCQGCHVLDGKGGNLGPELTFVGEKTPHEFSFAHVDHHETLRSVTTWLREHFRAPQVVSPGSLMPAIEDEQEIEALTAVMLSLRRTIPAFAITLARPEPKEASGGELYSMYCSACHAPDGRGNAIPAIQTPSLNNDDVLAVLDDNYLRNIIASGRRGTQMPGWGAGQGGLTRDEIDRIVQYMRTWQPEAASAVEVRAEMGDVRIGKRYFQGLCASCHGDHGEGGIGNRLNSPSFLAIASDRFLAESIIHGRPGTAMSSWKSLPTQAVSDLVAFIRTWQDEPPTFEAVQAAANAQPRRQLARDGRQLYNLYCASCHGTQAEGGIGPSLRTPDLLNAVDDRFLYRTIVEGRPTTGMPAWHHLKEEQIAAILAFLRSKQTHPERIVLKADLQVGDHISGEAHYRISCQQCHGELGSGGVGPQITNPVLLSTASDALLYHWIGRGRSGTAMKGFLPEAQGPARLTPEQITDVIAYLRYVSRGREIPLRRLGDGDPVRGGQVYAGTCASCHGHEGEGTWVPQLNNPNLLRSASDGYLAATIILGREGTAMRSMVHGQQGLGQIEPDQVQDVVAFLRLWEAGSTWRAPAQAVELSEQAIGWGRDLYAGYCKGCHGPNGRGLQDGPDYYAPALNNQDFLAAASDGLLLATIARGRKGTPMRPFGEGAGGIVSLKPEQISDIVSFIRSWQIGTPGSQRHAAAGGVSQ